MRKPQQQKRSNLIPLFTMAHLYTVATVRCGLPTAFCPYRCKIGETRSPNKTYNPKRQVCIMRLAVFHLSKGAIETENLFTQVKERLNLIEAAECYGVKPNRSGFVNCIFHNDKTPSMKLYPAHFHCYGCGKHGDIITLTEQLFSLSPYQAAQKLAGDFHIIQNGRYEKIKPVKTERQRYIEQEQRTYEILNFYCCYLEKCREDFKPETPDEDFHPLFIESLTRYDQYNYYRDIFITGTEEERREFMTDCKKELANLEQRFTPKNKYDKEQIA